MKLNTANAPPRPIQIPAVSHVQNINQTTAPAPILYKQTNKYKYHLTAKAPDKHSYQDVLNCDNKQETNSLTIDNIFKMKANELKNYDIKNGKKIKSADKTKKKKKIISQLTATAKEFIPSYMQKNKNNETNNCSISFNVIPEAFFIGDNPRNDIDIEGIDLYKIADKVIEEAQAEQKSTSDKSYYDDDISNFEESNVSIPISNKNSCDILNDDLFKELANQILNENEYIGKNCSTINVDQHYHEPKNVNMCVWSDNNLKEHTNFYQQHKLNSINSEEKENCPAFYENLYYPDCYSEKKPTLNRLLNHGLQPLSPLHSLQCNP